MATETEDPSKNLVSHSKFSKNNTTSTKNIKTTSQNILTTDQKEKKEEDNFDLQFNPFILPNSFIEKNIKSPNLHLEVINSWILPKGLILKITPQGLENSLRQKKDGISYFGFQDDIDQSPPYVDYLISPQDQEYDDKYLGKHFQIAFNQNDHKYYIKDLGAGFGTFVKLLTPLIIKDHYLLNIGDTYIVFNLDENKKEEIHINLLSGNETYEPFAFNASSKNEITIGRDFGCEISIEDKMLSRIHCVINFDNIKKVWTLFDGMGNKRPSTNGTWMYADEDTEIYEGMIFKANHNLFECKYKYK